MKKFSWIAILLMPCFLQAQQVADILLRHGKIVDGTGNPWFYGDMAIVNDTIAAIGNLQHWQAKRIIDANGLIIAPGFIDVHTHIENDEVRNPLATNFLMDGVTTVITGNCGLSRTNLQQYFSLLDSLHLAVNAGSLIGHNDVRKAVMGNVNRLPTDSELHEMEALVDKAMKNGAVGLSTGLIYTPGTYSKTPEIVALAKVAAAYNGVYATHMRDEGDSVTEAIEEALTIAREANIPLEISHFKLSGQQNWGRSNETLQMVVKARAQGLDVTIDQYPYTASSTSLSTLLPDWTLTGNNDSIKLKLQNKTIRKQCSDYMLAKLKKRKLAHFNYAVVAYYKADTTMNGKSIEQVNLAWKRKHTALSETETIMDMMMNGGSGMIFHGMSEQDVENIMKYPFNMIASDASIRILNEGAPHPRGYGSNARVLGKYVREQQLIPLEEAVRRMTSLPAQKFHIENRGLLRKGYAADIVVFDAATVKDMSTFEKPHQYSQGFRFVIVNGRLSIENGVQNNVRNGAVIYGPGFTR
ncbi:MAG TPA: D-aminoacylase [Panacibacter sp.]|nr:D-aminoacylase [Panacibacter sp.]HNP44732.1 D-aminoacylase [Panacibacter sp.]